MEPLKPEALARRPCFEVLLYVRHPMTLINRFLEPVAFIIIITDDNVQLAVQVEHPPSRITSILDDDVLLFRTAQHKYNILVGPGLGQTGADILSQQAGLLQGK